MRYVCTECNGIPCHLIFEEGDIFPSPCPWEDGGVFANWKEIKEDSY